MRKKIIHLIGNSSYGGGSKIILAIAKKSLENGFEVDILSTNDQLKFEANKHGIGIIDLNCIYSGVNLVKDFWGFLKLINFLKNQSSYDLIHTHTTKAGLIGRLAAFLANKKIIVHTIHGFAFHEKSNRIYIFICSLLERFAAKFSKKIVSVSEFHRIWSLNLRISNKSKLITIPNGINIDADNPQFNKDHLLEMLGVSKKYIVIICFSRLSKQKGLETLLQGVSLLKKQNRYKFKLLILGNGYLRKYLESLSRKLGIKDDVIFGGFVKNISDYLRASDLVILPSEREGMSLSLLEAMALQKPIIATSIGSNVEVTKNGECADLIPVNDYFSLYNSIQNFINNPKIYYIKAAKAKERFYNNYKEIDMTQKYLHLYEQLLN